MEWRNKVEGKERMGWDSGRWGMEWTSSGKDERLTREKKEQSGTWKEVGRRGGRVGVAGETGVRMKGSKNDKNEIGTKRLTERDGENWVGEWEIGNWGGGGELYETGVVVKERQVKRARRKR